MFYKSIIITSLILLFTACSTSDNAIFHTQFNFSAVTSYSIYHRNSDFTDTQNLADTRRNSIEIAIEKSMERRNFHYTKPEDADIVVTYHMIKNPSDYKRYNKAVLFCQQCLQANNWHQGSDRLTVKVNSLIIDLVDPNRRRSVWRSIQPLNIKDKDNSQEINEKIQQAVNDMLVQYPK
ncbi:hypothetical protein GCM10009111_09120 [Colwellia asteriadis]|uniref:DUF4136 domain-containing protein n=1 Tax=Colwellia asteriadis TaxID=517723 RepID=A0ABN1L4V2_9GAMM